MTPGVDQLFPSFPGFQGRGGRKPLVVSQTGLVAGFDDGGAQNIMSVYVSEIDKKGWCHVPTSSDTVQY